MKRLRILHVVPTFELGGVQTGILYSFEEIEKKFDYRILVLTNIDENWIKDLPPKIRDKILAPQSKSLVLSWIKAFLYILKDRPDLVICSLWKSVMPCAIYKLLVKKTHLVGFYHSAKIAHKVEFFFHKLLANVCDAAFCDSRATENFIQYTYKVYNTYDIPYIFKQEKGKFFGKELYRNKIIKMVFLGRLDPVKGLDKAIQFCNICIKRGINIKYTLFGDFTKFGHELKQIAKLLGIEDSIIFMDKIKSDDVNETLDKYDFYLQMSNYEGMALSVVEAMNRGLVPIVTPVGEIANYCKDGVNALLLHKPFEDNIMSLAERFLNLLDNPKEYTKMSINAEKTFDNWNTYYESFINAVEDIF